KDRARGALARSERFDAVRVVRSCCTLESRVLKEKKIPLEFDSTLETVYLKGDPNALYDLLVNLIRNAADASAARPAPIRVGLVHGHRDAADPPAAIDGSPAVSRGSVVAAAAAVVALSAAPAPARAQDLAVDTTGAAALIDQALNRSEVMRNLEYLTDVIGPR